MLLAATFIYLYTCTGTIVKMDAKSGSAVGHWEASHLLPKELAIDVRDGCLLNNVQYDSRGKRLLAIVPAEATVDAEGKRNHRLVAFELPSMHFEGSLPVPPTSAVPDIAPEGHVLFEAPAGEQHEIIVAPSQQLQWAGESRKRPQEAAVLDPAHQMAAKLSKGQHLSRLGLDGKHILVEEKGGKLAVYDASGKQTAEGKWPEKGRFICLAPGGRLAFYNVDSHLQVIQLPGGTAKPVAAGVEIDRTATCLAAPQ